MDIFKNKTVEMPAQDNVKVAQSLDELCGNEMPALTGDGGARSVQHAERPRYGHKV